MPNDSAPTLDDSSIVPNDSMPTSDDSAFNAFPMTLALVHRTMPIVGELTTTLERVCPPIGRVMRHWEDSDAFRRDLAEIATMPVIVVLDAEYPSVETVLAELPSDNVILVLCANSTSVRNQESVLRLLARYGTEIIVAPFDGAAVKRILERCRNTFASRVLSRESEAMLLGTIANIHAARKVLETAIDDTVTIARAIQNDIDVAFDDIDAANIAHIQLPTAQGDVIFAVESIMLFEGKREMTICSVFEAASGTVQKTTVFLMLSAVEEKLPKRDFVRVHKSFIVNVGYALRFEHNGKDGILTMKHGEPPLTVTRVYKKALLERLKGSTRPTKKNT